MEHQKSYTVREVLEITIRNLHGIAGEVPMKYKQDIFDPLQAQIENLRLCVEAEKAAEQPETIEQDEEQKND